MEPATFAQEHSMSVQNPTGQEQYVVSNSVDTNQPVGIMTSVHSTADASFQQYSYTGQYSFSEQTEQQKLYPHLSYQYDQSTGSYFISEFGRDRFNLDTANEPYTVNAVEMTSFQNSTQGLNLNANITEINNSEIDLSMKDLPKHSQDLGNANDIKATRQQAQPTPAMMGEYSAEKGVNANEPLNFAARQPSLPVINVPYVSFSNPTNHEEPAPKPCSDVGISSNTKSQKNTQFDIPSHEHVSFAGHSGVTVCNGMVCDNKEYTCGGCFKKFSTICLLHAHMKEHDANGSYFFFSSTHTGYPRFETFNKDTQTDEEICSKKRHPKLRTKRNRKKAFGQDAANINMAESETTDCKSKNKSTKTDTISAVLEKGKETTTRKDSNIEINNGRDDETRHKGLVNTAATSLMENSLNTMEESGPEEMNKLENDNTDTDEYCPDSNEYHPAFNLVKSKKTKRKTKVSVKDNTCKKAAGKNKKVMKENIKKGNGRKKKVEVLSVDKANKSSKILSNKHESIVAPIDFTLSKEAREHDKKDEKRNNDQAIKVTKSAAKRHVKIECSLCNITFPKRSNLRVHIKTSHSGLPYICTLCSENCDSKQELMDHKKSVHRRNNYQCELCDKVLSTKGMLEGHYLIHKGIKPFACTICEPKREFTRKCQLKAHMETHSEEKNLQCEFCGKPFNARYLMINHVKHCSGEKPYKCQFCEMGFVSNHCLQRHLRTHTGEKPFICEVCAFASGNASCLARHMRTHTGEKPFVCKYCQQTFAAPGALKKHVRIHTQEKPYKCSYCTKAFTQRWNLKTHERQHTGETPYKCHVCGVGYKQNVLLKSHLATHYGGAKQQGSKQTTTPVNQSDLSIQGHLPAQSGMGMQPAVPVQTNNVVPEGKPFKCSYCTKSFTQRRNLKAHERQHAGVTALKCPVCGMNFEQKVLLETHLKSHYGCSEHPDQSTNQSISPINQSGFTVLGNMTTQSEMGTQSVIQLPTGSMLTEVKPATTALQVPGPAQIPDFQHPAPVLPSTILVSCLTNPLYSSMS